jgi:hypothetical protein
MEYILNDYWFIFLLTDVPEDGYIYSVVMYDNKKKYLYEAINYNDIFSKNGKKYNMDKKKLDKQILELFNEDNFFALPVSEKEFKDGLKKNLNHYMDEKMSEFLKKEKKIEYTI